MAPHVLIEPEDPDAVEAVLVIEQDPLPFGQNGVVRGVPRDPEPFGHAGAGQVLDHDPFQGPAQPAARDLGAWLRGERGVLAPHVITLGTAVAAHRDLECGRAPAQRLVRQPPHHRVSCRALAAAAVAPLVGFDDQARQHRTVGLESLPDHGQAEAIKSSEGGQISAGEAGRRGSVRHVEVFQMSGVGTFIFGRPRPLSRHRRAATSSQPGYTLIWEEPIPRESAPHTPSRITFVPYRRDLTRSPR